jgi:hypothetical protein
MPDDEDKAWELVREQAWHDTVESWPWRQLGGGAWGKSGPCPRCGTVMTLKDGVETVFLDEPEGAVLERMVQGETPAPAIGAIELSTGDWEIDGDRTFFASCDCEEEHHGRPKRLTKGCGAWSYIYPSPAEGGNE